MFLFAFVYTQAQINYSSNFRSKKIYTKGVVHIDDASIVPPSFSIKGYDDSYYFIDYEKSNVTWKKKLSIDSVIVQYRVFDFGVNRQFQKFNYDSIKNNFISQSTYKPYVYSNATEQQTSNSLDLGKIKYSGSFGRNISFGNNQDAVFNSQLNLQLSGIIGDSIEVAAAITDNNIPIQPDGTTQRINEFDKILLQFKKKNTQLSLGDIDLRQSKNYFLNFYKRLQGVSLQVNKKNNNSFNFTGAIAKGKFTRFVFNGLEGNQGPYRLQGANGEIYFIVLAGTERVFIDGELMKRGEDLDYVINYNTGEILFTAKRMITKDKRIQVEFEYAERSFLNSMFYVSNESNLSKNFKLSIAAYTNSDAKNSPINQQLDANQKQFLANLGNDYQNAFYPYASIDSFSTTKILYKKVVNPVNSNDSIYVYSTSKDSAKYNLSFAEVGVNKGNYVPLFNAANGKVYQWVAPVNNIPQGNYEPAQFLVTPKTQQVITIATDYQINKNTLLKTDLAYSNYDVNTFSSLNKNENKGYAGKFILQKNNQLKKDLFLNSLVSYEYVQQNFKSVERLRSVEFSRDWGLPIIASAATEHLPKLSFELKDKQNNYVSYTVEAYIRSDNYKGLRHTINNQHNIKDIIIKSAVSLTNNSTPLQKGFFLKPYIEVSKLFKQLKNITIGSSYALEYNEQSINLNDSLTANSFAFETISAYIKSNQALSNKWQFNYFTRVNKTPISKDLVATDRSHNYNFTTELLGNNSRQLRLNMTYRELKALNQNIANLKSDNTLLSRLEYTFNELNGFANGYVLYELGAGQEQRRDFSYVEVQAGRGQYTWNDYNNDGIPQLNEFELAVFQDQAKYIKIFTPTNQFIKANYNTFNYSISLNPRGITSTLKSESLKKFINRFMFNSALQASNKIISDGLININPFTKPVSDTSLISSSKIFSNTLSFNRNSSSWGIDVTNVNSSNKTLLTYGLEGRQQNEWTARGRYNIKRAYTIECVSKLSNTSLATPQFANRNYDIHSVNIEPKFIYTYMANFRVQLSYNYIKKDNAIAYGAEQSTSNSINFETKYNAINNNSLSAKFSYNNIQYDGAKNTTVSFIMLDGLLPGKNYLWNIEFSKRLKNNFEINFSYEGRKVGEGKVINIGRAGVRAIL